MFVLLIETESLTLSCETTTKQMKQTNFQLETKTTFSTKQWIYLKKIPLVPQGTPKRLE